MDQLQKTLKLETNIQTRLLKECRDILKKAPEGWLYVRKRSRITSYYQIIRRKTSEGWKTRHVNITDNPAMIQALTEKMLASQTEKICVSNLNLLENCLSDYHSYDQESLLLALPSKYQDVKSMRKEQQIRQWMQAPYEKALFDPKKHIHETAYGGLVRSKSETIIANALYSYGIPFHYEERFPIPNENGNYYYPDFTILLPEKGFLIWEHLGLLKDLDYCVSNAQKLHTYQQNNVVIGRNLILTQDDNQGNCSSSITYQIINDFILPHFSGVTLEPGLIREAAELQKSRISLDL